MTATTTFFNSDSEDVKRYRLSREVPLQQKTKTKKRGHELTIVSGADPQPKFHKLLQNYQSLAARFSPLMPNAPTITHISSDSSDYFGLFVL